MLPIEVKIVFKDSGLNVWYFDSYCKAFELVNSVNPCEVTKIEINFKN